MAEFEFYGSWEDSLEILDRLIEINQFTFVLDKWYIEATPISFKVLRKEDLSNLEKTPNLFLYSDKYSVFPPYFSEPTSDNLWRIFPLRSGPALKLALPRIYIANDKQLIGGGWLLYQSKYWHPETLEYYSPPEALKDAFNFVKKIIIQNCVKRYIPFRYFTTQRVEKYQVRTLYIGRYGIELLHKKGYYLNIGKECFLTDDVLFTRRVDVEKQIEQIRSQ